MASLVENNETNEKQKNINEVVKEKYTDFLLEILNNSEDESIKNSIEVFLENSNETNFIEIFVQNFLIHIQEILESNIDFFATQKKYVYISKKGKKLKKRNPRRSYIFGNDDEQLFSNYLIHNNKIQYKLGTKYLQYLYDIIYLITFKNNSNQYEFCQEVLDIINNDSKYSFILENLNTILSSIDEETEEEIVNENEDEEESDEENKDNSKKNSGGTPFNVDFIKNSQIGKLAEDISKSINPEELNFDSADPASIMKSLFSGNADSNEGIGKLVKHVFSEVEQRISSNSINEDALADEAKNFLGSMGGGLGGLGGLAEIFGNKSDFSDGGSVPKTKSKSKSTKKK